LRVDDRITFNGIATAALGLGRVKTRKQVLNRPWLQCIEALEACEQYFSDFVCSAT
jgi:hypothetical protein